MCALLFTMNRSFYPPHPIYTTAVYDVLVLHSSRDMYSLYGHTLRQRQCNARAIWIRHPPATHGYMYIESLTLKKYEMKYSLKAF